jgi:hypothetical protein
VQNFYYRVILGAHIISVHLLEAKCPASPNRRPTIRNNRGASSKPPASTAPMKLARHLNARLQRSPASALLLQASRQKLEKRPDVIDNFYCLRFIVSGACMCGTNSPSIFEKSELRCRLTTKLQPSVFIWCRVRKIFNLLNGGIKAVQNFSPLCQLNCFAAFDFYLLIRA